MRNQFTILTHKHMSPANISECFLLSNLKYPEGSSTFVFFRIDCALTKTHETGHFLNKILRKQLPAYKIRKSNFTVPHFIATASGPGCN